MQQQASIEIDRSIEEVFEYTTNHVAEWSLTVVAETMLEETADVVGSRFLCVTEDHGRRMEFEGVIIRHEPPHRSAVHLAGAHFDIDAEYIFEDLGDRTRVTQMSSVAPRGWFKVFFVLFGWLMQKSGCKALQNELNSLKEHLEFGAQE